MKSTIKHTKLRVSLALSLVCVLLAGAIANAADSTSTGTSYIKYSKSSDRSNSVALNGAVVSGNIYVHLSDKTINSAMYFLDINGNYDNKLATSAMRSFPQDFQYRNSDGTAKPFDTRKLVDGKHTLAVRTRDAVTNKYTMRVAYFIVKNTVTTTTTAPTTTTSLAPTTTTTVAPTTTTTLPPVFVPKFAGDVSPGKIRWGSSIGGNSDPVVRHGEELANRMGIRRTFWSLDKRASLVSTAKADLAANRLPWVSIKVPGSWKENGDGVNNAALTALLNDLSALDGPVWFTIHHEPEGGCKPNCAANGMDDIGGPSEWLRMQENASNLIKQLRAQGKAKNVAFASILMGWTFDPASGRTPTQWYKPGIWDFAGLDVYSEQETISPFIVANGLGVARKFYAERGLKVAIGEWGIRNQTNAETDAGEIPTLEEQQQAAQRMENFYNDALRSANDGQGAQIIGASYFDSALNSENGSWELKYLQLTKFRELITRATSLSPKQY